MKNLSQSRQNLIIKVLRILADEKEESGTSSEVDLLATPSGREYLLDDEKQMLYELEKLLKRED